MPIITTSDSVHSGRWQILIPTARSHIRTNKPPTGPALPLVQGVKTRLAVRYSRPSGSLGDEFQGDSVVAIAKAGRWRAILEYVTLVTPTA